MVLGDIFVGEKNMKPESSWITHLVMKNIRKNLQTVLGMHVLGCCGIRQKVLDHIRVDEKQHRKWGV